MREFLIATLVLTGLAYVGDNPFPVAPASQWKYQRPLPGDKDVEVWRKI